MQILAGKYKGVDIQTSAKLDYRPTQSRVRKSLFDILGNLEGKTVLDLFAGSGILGFEALSRGAKTVTFVESNRKLINLLYKNSLKVDSDICTIKNRDAFNYLRNCIPVDLILADPPYEQNELNLLIDLSIDMINPGGTFVLEASTKDEHTTSDSVKIYGSTKLSFWRKQ